MTYTYGCSCASTGGPLSCWLHNGGPTHYITNLFPVSATVPTLKFMPPGHFCPDVCGIEDFGEADYLRGRVVRAFFRLMARWPHPGGAP